LTKPLLQSSNLALSHAILAFAAQHDLKIHQMGTKAAYLNAKLKEEIYMKAPPGLNVPEGMVLCLKKVVYGMKQGSCTWYEDICSMLTKMGYT
jgi:hypothetical protein